MSARAGKHDQGSARDAVPDPRVGHICPYQREMSAPPFGAKGPFPNQASFFSATPHRGGLVLTGGILKSKCRVPQRRATARAVASWMWVGAAMPRVWSQLCTVSQQSERVHVRGSRKIIRKAPRSLPECSVPSQSPSQTQALFINVLRTALPGLFFLKLSRQDSFGTPVGVRLSFLYPSPMRGSAWQKKLSRGK